MNTKALEPMRGPRAACKLCEALLSKPARQRRHFRLPARYQSPTLRLFHPHLDAPTAARRAAELGQAILSSDSIPPEEEVIEALRSCELAAAIASGASESPTQSTDPSATTTLLSLDNRADTASTKAIPDILSELSFRIISHPPVFINAAVLASYVNTQCMLERPQTLPEAFTLYAHKPVPTPGSNPPVYKEPNPDKISQAVPEDTAADALDAAIIAKDLDLALAIINSAYRTKAYRNDKLFKKLGVPVTIASLAPLGVYIIATQAASLQDMVDNSYATGAAFAGFMTYLGAVSMLGYISITTSNDQMKRVVWRPGMGLTERWIREDERAALDKVAMAWGFKEDSKRGLEEGAEWDYLRDWISKRGMILDKTDLMEGME
ncbi:hypothetical protein EJ05DRAFT_186981 [Pseudovirgaria hyperparasitica]|uniref:Uncharacterized protein n=1 Tax=Pseudovirgaria hyperparasitica TaxID=470096 RepID=A0A6A6WGE6_9PEZI|nr:uncharacterized protein EJ05DRAFT_186981 [Pseudovirgaria hyperparasitica]KAF2761853.1 hypothetical protein EJ05DRAFT_186981 [Pseudovirgaria hyperparasitica]